MVPKSRLLAVLLHDDEQIDGSQSMLFSEYLMSKIDTIGERATSDNVTNHLQMTYLYAASIQE